MTYFVLIMEGSSIANCPLLLAKVLLRKKELATHAIMRKVRNASRINARERLCSEFKVSGHYNLSL